MPAALGRGSVVQTEAPGADYKYVKLHPSDATVVFWLDISLLALLAIFVLFTLPRTIARYSSASEWSRGLFLRAGPVKSNLLRPISREPRNIASAVDEVNHAEDEVSFISSRTAGSAEDLAGQAAADSSTTIETEQKTPPTHVPTIGTLTYPISSILSYPITLRKTLGKVVLAVLYFAAVVFVAFYHDSPLSHPQRLGYIAVSQIPVVFILGTKNNLVGYFVGVGYEKLNFYHRCVGIVIFVTANFHALGFLYKWADAGKLRKEFEKPFIIVGAASLAGVELTFLFSLPLVRQRAYTFFLFSHITGFLLFPIAVCFHQPIPSVYIYVIIAAAIFGLDYFLRFAKTRICTAELIPVPELFMTMIELPNIKYGWRAGQHVRVRFLTTQLGLFDILEVHPLSIANAAGGRRSDKGLTLMSKCVGGWSRRLYKFAQMGLELEEFEGIGEKRLKRRKVKVFVEGPYGGLGNMVLASYSAAIIIVGGSGVTFGLSEVEELLQKALRGQSRVKIIELVWITPNISSLKPILPIIASHTRLIQNNPTLSLSFGASIYYTNALSSSEELEEDETSSSLLQEAGSALVIRPGRPDIPRILEPVLSNVAAFRDPKGVAVCSCGPIELVAEAKEAVRLVNGVIRRSVGGVEIHEEVYAW